MHGKFATIVFILFLSLPVSGQQSPNAETPLLPDSVMQQVVSRILIWSFKPARQPRTIPIADRAVKREWLPSIRNITFQLASENDVLKSKNGVFLFEDLKRTGRHYSINVGWGDLDCWASGDAWAFNSDKTGKVRLWRLTAPGWGRGCGEGGGTPTIRGLKVGEVSPNEIRGYEFFAKGKLDPIRLGISTKDDVISIFGGTCESQCDYDDRWQLSAEYFKDTLAFTKTTNYGQPSEVATEYFPRSEFVGKLSKLELTPKKPISFLKAVFPKTFGKNVLNSVGDAWNEQGFAGAVHSTTNVYADGYGLEYRVYEEETFNNLIPKEQERHKVIPKGDLRVIEYRIPKSLDDIVYVGRVKNVEKK